MLNRLFAVLWMLALMPACISRPVSSEGSSSAPEPDVRQLAEMEYRITRARLDAALAWLEQDNGCYFVPFERERLVVGVKVYGVKRKSLPDEVGIRNGDMIAEVSGIPVNTADAAFRVRDEFRRENRFTVNLERDGKKVTLVLWITDPGSQQGGPTGGCS